jgi:hypothetical protein
MTLKTFNVDGKIYDAYSRHCKKNGISMSKQVEKFLQAEIGKLGLSAEKLERLNFKAPGKMEKFAKEIEKLIEHPLKKYC